MWIRSIALAAALSFAAHAGFAQAPAPAPNVQELERLLQTLENDGERQRLIGQIRALIALQAGAVPAAEPAPAAQPAEPQTPERVAARAIEALAREIGGIGAAILGAASFLADAPSMWAWAREAATDPELRVRVGEILVMLALILGVAWPAEFIVIWLLRGLRQRLETAAIGAGWWRLLYGLYHAAIALVPIIVYTLAAFAVIAAWGPSVVVGLVAIALINAGLIARAIGLIAWAILAPRVAALRLVPLSDETATYAHIWVRRIAAVAVYGEFLASAAWIVGLPYGAYQFLLRLLGVVVALLLAVLILQNRQQVAAEILGDEEGPGVVRRRVAEFWHVAALAYVGVILTTWLIRPDGLGDEFRATLLTVIILAFAWGAMRLLRRIIRRAFTIAPDVQKRFPTLQARAGRYSQVFNVIGGGAIWLFAAVAILQAWGLGSFSYLGSPSGRRTLGGLVAIGLTVAIAVAIWEFVRLTLERAMNRAKPGDDEERRRAARLRTLIPLFNRVLMSILVAFVILVLLSELGLNIAPLLAISGVVGIAVGLGAQQLMRDLIAGITLMIEDSVAVGDVVRIGERSGVVESMSIRSLRLRAVDGTVHTIPYGDFNVISNQSKDFSYAVVEIMVPLSENVERALTLIRDIATELRADPEYAPIIREAFELFGVDRFTDTAIVYRGRFRTLPGRQWRVQRAFYHRLKIAFDRAGLSLGTTAMPAIPARA